MQIEKECEPYLKSLEVISILQSGNETFKSRVLNCINKYKNLICSNVILKHRFIETDILLMCCESAFQDAQLIFVRRVEENKFSPDYETCIPFLKGIFKKTYLGEYRKELNRKELNQKMASKNVQHSTINYNMDENEKAIREKIKAIVLLLSTQEQQIFKFYYEDGFKLKEIADLLHLQYQTVREKASKIGKTIGNNWNLIK